MATQHQRRTAIRTGKIPSGQSTKLNPRERLKAANIWASSRDTNSARIKYEKDDGLVYGGKVETSATYHIFNVDGEVYLKPDTSSIPSAYGRHPADERAGYKDEEANPDLRAKADKLAKELQKVVDDAGQGDPPTERDVRIRELTEDKKRFQYGTSLISLSRYEELNSPLGGLRQKATKTAKRLEELTKQIQEQIDQELAAAKQENQEEEER